jgi:uncharacterized membrane protein YfbV (UPF0208 family)
MVNLAASASAFFSLFRQGTGQTTCFPAENMLFFNSMASYVEVVTSYANSMAPYIKTVTSYANLMAYYIKSMASLA